MTTTALATGKQVPVFVVINHLSANCVGLHTAKGGTRSEALQPIRQGVKEPFGAIDESVGAGLLPIRHDNGPQVSQPHLQGRDSLAGNRFVPALRSLSPRQRLHRAIHPPKENPLWPETHSCTEDLQRALQRFKDKYNEKWLIERHRHRLRPSQFTRDEDETRTTA